MGDIRSRQASRVLHITDAKGNPCVHQTFHMKQKKHEFLFGCGAFDAMPRANEEKDNPFYIERMEKWLDVFNFGTMSFYWGQYEPEEGKPQFENRMNASRFLQERGVTVKGHPLCWQTECAQWLLKYDDKTIMEKQLERIYRDVTAFAGVIDMWDVINETVIMPVYDRYENAATRLAQRYGRNNLIKEVFTAAKAANPDALLLINDFNSGDEYRKVIAECLEAGAPIDAIGIQTHQHQGYMGRKKLEEIVNRFAPLGLPIHFTENTLVSGHIMPAHIVDLNDYQIPEWPTTPEGEARQADEIDDMFSYLFETPSVGAVTGWDFTDGAWLGAPSGVLRLDNSCKPSYFRLQEMIHSRWHTEETVCTDENGNVTVSGYKGSYELTGEGGKTKFQLTDGSSVIELTL